MLDPWIEWLVQQVNTAFNDKKAKLDKKCYREKDSFICWAMITQHVQFEKLDNIMPEKFNICLDSVIKKQTSMRTIKLKHPEETSKNSDICDFSKVSVRVKEWWTMRNLYFKPFLLVQ